MKRCDDSRRVESFHHLSAALPVAGKCQGLACFLARHQDVQLWRNAVAQTPRIYCLGKCYLAPATANDDQRPQMCVLAPQGIVLERLVLGGARTFSQYQQQGGYRAIEMALGSTPQEIVRQLEDSGLRGRGGAGFPTGKKWRAVLDQDSTTKIVIANGDEGDPGAYIDRFLLEDDPHCLIEGLLIAAYAVGADRGYIYVRCEYPEARRALERALNEARCEGLLGERVLGSPLSFDIALVIGKGSYVCGEETALLNSIESKRPEVKLRPPYPTEEGLFGKPTLVNNVETLASVPWILRNGAKAFRALGFSDSRGTKVISLNSLFRRPGLYEIEFGIPVRAILEDIGGGLKTGACKGVIIGGPLAGVIPPHLFDTRFGFEELHAIGAAVGHGGILAFDKNTSIPQLVHHVFEFGAFESCGKCTPCRLGSLRIAQLFANVLDHGPGSALGRTEWQDIISALSQASLCGLGTGLGEFGQSIRRYYAGDIQKCFE